MSDSDAEKLFEGLALTSRVQALYTYLEEQNDPRLEELKKVSIEARERYNKDCKEGNASFDVFTNESIPAKAVFSYVEQNHHDLYSFIQKACKFWDED